MLTMSISFARGTRIKVLPLLVSALALGVVMGGCKKHDPVVPTQPIVAPQKVAAIAWYDGGVDGAFAQARTQGKPVFLYWGAVWCPPRNQLKSTVFSRPDFIEKSKLFVAVHLDGDDAGAQKWGESFHVSGYPTVVILRPDRTELARIAGGMDLTQYAQVLDLALGDVRPVQAVRAALDAGGANLSPDDCRRLAYNAWELDDPSTENWSRTAQSLQRAASRCPASARVERARLLVVAAYAAARAQSAALKAGKPPSPGLASLVRGVDELLADRELALASADILQDFDKDFFSAAIEVEPGRKTELLQHWVLVMDAMASDGRYAEADQISAIASKLKAMQSLDAAHGIPVPLVDAANARIDATLARTRDEHARPAVVNASLDLLDVLGEDDRAYAVLDQEVKTSKTPYYYMLDLATLEEKRGHKDAAVTLLGRAYRESQGTATRFQWGTVYVRGLVRMRPQDEAGIRDATLAVLAELDGPDRIYRRSRVGLEKLDGSLREWDKNSAHAGVITVLRKRMDEVCGKIPTGDPARQPCESFLAKA